MKKKSGKKVTKKNNFYLPILNYLKDSTNLSKLRKKLNISKQNLNYYLRELKKKGFVISLGNGRWELTERGKNPTKYGIFLKEDMTRGHAYIWEVEIEKIPKNWSKRIEVLEKRKINYKLVGALKTTPRIKVLGRKVWLCNNHLRIFDIEKQSYYGDTEIESRINSKIEAMKVARVCENKLGLKLNIDKIIFKKEHYALIRNSLAIEHNQKGIIMRIKDENGDEWLLIDDSLGEGGELENIGKKAFQTHAPMRKWWNDLKNNNFPKTSDLIEKIKQQQQILEESANNNLKLSEQNLALSKIIEEMNRRDAWIIAEINKLKTR